MYPVDHIMANREAEHFAPAPRARESWSLYDELTRLGNVYRLDFPLSPNMIAHQLEALEESWVQYNPYKPHIPRRGLSVTSLDGKMGGKPDLYSLKELYKTENALYQEKDFCTLTEVYQAVPAVHGLIDYFSGDLGRTHFLRFDAGGYFPPHRDSASVKEIDTFRLLVPVTPPGRSSYYFMLDGQPLHLIPGSVYFINTMIAHSVFSFKDNLVFLICNIILNERTVEKVKAKLWER